ncbi:VOC family protein [Nocardioides stalactiti]|uniref:VOC family protein n=1 Tax=Nocardioides stalactiti TaxID=2755356 RepID=UPI001603DF2A|nr:VOC family protein [Nocardioides stalactiti]
MIDHLGINCADLEASKRFYDTVLATLGYRRLMDFDVAVGYGKDKPDFWLSAYEDMPPNREVHIAFQAADPAAVEAFFETARSLGAETLHAPRLWPEYHERYFGAFVRDLDGNNIEAVCHHAPTV